MNDDLKTKQYLLDHDFKPNLDLAPKDASEFLVSSTYQNKPLLRFKVATLMKNASGVQLTYRGGTHLPNISPHKGKKSLGKSSTVRDLQTTSFANMTRPKASSI